MSQSLKDQESVDYTQWFNENFRIGLSQILKFSINNPAMAFFILKTIVRFYFADRRRRNWAEKGVKVPPMLIYSITSE